MVAKLTSTAEATAKDASPAALPEQWAMVTHQSPAFMAMLPHPWVLGHLGHDWFRKHSIPWLHVQKVAFVSFCSKAWLLSPFIRVLFPPSSFFLFPSSPFSPPCPALPNTVSIESLGSHN